MTDRTRASSRLPLVVVLLAVAAVAVYFGRDLLRSPEPARVAGQTPVEDPGAGNLTSPSPAPAVAGAESEAPAGQTTVSAESVAEAIVDKITEPSAGESAARAGDGSGTAESAGAAPQADPAPSPDTLAATAGTPSGQREAHADGAEAPQDLSAGVPEPAPAGENAGPEAAALADTPDGADSGRPPERLDGEPVETAEAGPGQGDASAGNAAAGSDAGNASALAGLPEGAGNAALNEEIADLVAREISGVTPPPDPMQVASAAAEAAAEYGLDGESLKHAVTEAVVEKQAESFVAALVEPEAHPIDVSRADHFVPMEQVVSLLPESAFEVTTRDELMKDPEIGPRTPITVVRAVEQVEVADPARIIAAAGGDLDREIRILDGDEVRVETVRQVLRDFIDTSMETISILAEVKYFEITTLAEFAQRSDLGPDEPLTVVKDRYRLEAATVAELLRTELDLPSDAIFYLRTVRPGDTQGIWGIVQDGLIGNFARGMAIRYGRSINTYQVEIPRDADELLANQSSSFLGRLIHAKTLESYVYNFVRHRMGRNPHRIHPDQEIAIINFTPEELVSIYKHFVARHGASG